jgi:hypothetical protein
MGLLTLSATTGYKCSSVQCQEEEEEEDEEGPGHSAGTIFIIINVLVLDTQRSNR